MRASVLFVIVAFLTGAPHAQTSSEEPKRERITDRKKGESTAKTVARFPIRLATLPLWVLDRGLYHGMIAVDEKRLVPRVLFVKQRLADFGIVPQIGGAGDGAGFGGGVAWTFYQGPLTPTSSVSASVRGYQDHGLELDFSEMVGERFDFTAQVRYRSRPEEDFFGIGPESRKENRTSYNLEQTTVALDVEARLAGAVTAAGRVAFSNNNVSSGEDTRFPSIEDRFNDLGAPGLDDGAELVTAGLVLTLDGRDHPGAATTGGLVSVFAGIGEDTEGGPFNYSHYGGEVQGFLPLLGRDNRFGPRSLLAVRVRGEFNQPRNSGTVPFFVMPRIGGSSSVRGFREFRFTDENMVIANIEYRWPIMSLKTAPLVEAVLFVDEGQVFDRSDEFDFNNFREAYGGGLRVLFMNSVFFRIEVGRSDETTRLFTKFRATF